MTKFQCVGVRKVDYIKKGTDRRVCGVTLYYTRPSEDDRIQGCTAGEQYIPQSVYDFCPIGVGDFYVPLYDVRFGKPYLIGLSRE